MAKLGEGDARWIVEERADGANVHNWHWAERDALAWAKTRFNELLGELTVLEGQGDCWIKTTGVDSVEGDAYVNVRKGKIIPGYELKVRLSWLGEIRDTSGNRVTKVEGKVEMPYIADENADEDAEVKISTSESGPTASRLRDAMLATGKPMIVKQVKVFVADMAAGGPASEELANAKAGKSGPAGTPAPPVANTESSGKTTESSGKSVPKPAEVASKGSKDKDKDAPGFKTLKLNQKFHCRKGDIYEVLLDERRWMAFTQSKASIKAVVGGAFTIFDGAVSGQFQKLEHEKLIVQKWRFNNWPDGVHSTVRYTLFFLERSSGACLRFGDMKVHGHVAEYNHRHTKYILLGHSIK